MQAPVKIEASTSVRTVDRVAGDSPARTVPDLNSSQVPAADREVVLSVEGLGKSFRSGFLKRRLRGIEDISFSVTRGSVFALLGHNGAGKTTTINCILDLVHPDRGTVAIMGADHRNASARFNVGYLPERPYFFEHLTGRELLKFYGQLLGLAKDKKEARIDEVLDMVGMAAFAGRRLSKYSKGMLQRMGLAQAILGDPDLLILDEPMSGLDPIGRREIRELLMKLKREGKTIILSSHIVPDVEMIADTVGILKQGSLVSVRNLTELNHGFSYTGELVVGTARVDWLPRNRRNLDDGRVEVRIDSVDELRELLNNCHRESIGVVSLETHRSTLEEMFMDINRDAPDKREVAR